LRSFTSFRMTEKLVLQEAQKVRLNRMSLKHLTFYRGIISGTQHYPVGCPDFSPASWPQAALISCPRLSLIITV